ncbi:MAG: hypothetical protein RR654_07895, partial [Oscillospiraceae bacterium]
PDQASFEVQAIDQQQSLPIINGPASQNVAPKRGFLYRAFQKVMKAISFCMVTRHVAKWKHKERSSATLEEARRKAEEIATQINRPEGKEEGAKDPLLKVGAPVEQEQGLKNDPTKAPIVWEQAQGTGYQDPTVEVHTQPGDMFSNLEGTNTTANSFVVLRYSKQDYGTGHVRRFRLAFGFAPRVEVDHDVMLGLAATIPGELQNQANARSSVGKSYSISEQQVDAILSAAPKEADKGYNLITHNCTTFAVNILGEVGVSDGGLQQQYTDMSGELEQALPMAAARGARRLEGLREDMLNQMDDNDYSVARQGKKQIDYKDMERFESSLNYDGPASLVGYEAGMVGEQLRGINAAGGNAGSVAIADFESVASADGVSEKIELLNKYDNEKTAHKVNGAASKLVKPIVALAQELETKALSVDSMHTNSLNITKSKKDEIWAERQAYLSDHNKFDGQKNDLTAAVQEWMSKLDGTTDRELQLLGYRLIGELGAIEKEYYQCYNESLALGKGINEENSTAYSILYKAKITNVDDGNLERNPLYIREFTKVFGDDTIDDVQDRLDYHRTKREGLIADDKNETALEINTINKKKAAVMDHFATEMYKLNQLARNENVGQALVNDAFAKPSQESNIAKDPGQMDAIIFMSAMFPNAYGAMQRKGDATKEIKNGHLTLTLKGQCIMAEEALKIATDGITANQDGLFVKMIEAIAYKSQPPLGKSQIVKEVLGRFFNQFFMNVTAPDINKVIMGLSDPDRAHPPKNVSREIQESLLQKQAMFVSQIESIIDRVLSSK